MNEHDTGGALVPVNHSSAIDRIQDPIAAVEKMGTWFAKSGMFGCEKQEQGQILALAAILEKKSPIEIADTYHLVDGRLTMKSRAQLAKFRAAGGRVKWTTTDAKAATGIWSFEGNDIEISFTMEEAKLAGLIRKGSGWEKTPAEMLRARCTTRAITMLAPEILFGGSIEDEVAASAPVAPAPNPLKAGTPPLSDEKKAKAGKNDSRSEERAAARENAAEEAPRDAAGGTYTERLAEEQEGGRPTKAGSNPENKEIKVDDLPEPKKKPRKSRKTVKKDAQAPQEAFEASEGDNTAETAPDAGEGKSEAEKSQEAKAAEAIEEGVGDEAPEYASIYQIKQIMEIVADCEEDAIKWLTAKKWIPSADKPTKISPENAAQIIKAPDKFLRAVAKLAAKK